MALQSSQHLKSKTMPKIIDLQKTIYNSSNPTRKRLHQSRFGWVLKKIYKYSDIKKSAVEYGPGSGIYLNYLDKCNEVTFAVDIEEIYLDNIKKNISSYKNLHLLVDDIQNSKIVDRKFDLILCSEVIEHISNPSAAINNLFRSLNDGGIVILTTPQKFSILELCSKVALSPIIIDITRKIYKEPIEELGHISLLTSNSLHKIILESGFEVLEQKKLGLYLPLIAELGFDKFIVEIEKLLSHVHITWPLWTQCYVLRKS
ncbi:2-polyprenyl-3-methyl-5-hydroxy-6-metoxy-1,4-benzoquinol methylase [Polynucleobacter sphagniphilus]|uniref:class I SAM-dependent methyltransferase n=1 Tax=Polynucleobacter sphagniphilus TaxID=1743169 RepID=UPI002473C92E|nr:class I SAM-dependent methyltransferase [Polynucleobacter sphagniphilus]MDH6154050.1 2-polyprenyl-3-methyl-5-hydroxy-6-metoxy-1,4-benzoquinol methylase [Polynucleobacter sphagniphilus]